MNATGINAIHLGKFLIETAPKIGDLELPTRAADRPSPFDDDQWLRAAGPRGEKRDPQKKSRYRTERRDR